RDAGSAQQPGREPAVSPPPAAGQLPSRVSARLGQQDLLHTTAPGPAAPRECRRVVTVPAWGGREPATTHPVAHYAHRRQSLFPGRERADTRGDRGPRG